MRIRNSSSTKIAEVVVVDDNMQASRLFLRPEAPMCSVDNSTNTDASCSGMTMMCIFHGASKETMRDFEGKNTSRSA